jgi:ferredoxin
VTGLNELPPAAGEPAEFAGPEHRPRVGFFTDTSGCIGCKACEVACKERNQIPEDGLTFTGMSYDNTQGLGGGWAPRPAVVRLLIVVPAATRPRVARLVADSSSDAHFAHAFASAHLPPSTDMSRPRSGPSPATPVGPAGVRGGTRRAAAGHPPAPARPLR